MTMDLSRLQHIKIQVREPQGPNQSTSSEEEGGKMKKRRKKAAVSKTNSPSSSSWLEVRDPFDFMRPFLPASELHSLSLCFQSAALGSTTSAMRRQPGVEAIITQGSFQSLLHLTLKPIDVEVLTSLIEQHRFPRLQSLTVGGFSISNHPGGNPGAMKRFLLSLVQGMEDLTSVELLCGLGLESSGGESNLSCLLAKEGLNLMRSTRFTVSDPNDLRMIDSLVSPDPTWNHKAFAATLCVSASSRNLATSLPTGKRERSLHLQCCVSLPLSLSK